MSVKPAVLENIDIKASTSEIVDFGQINGYNYRVFRFIEGKSLSHRQEKGFEDLDKEQKIERIRQIGEAMANVHESRSFEGFGAIQTLNNEIIGTSSSNWSEGLREIQHFWHNHVGGQEFEEVKEEIEDYYSEKGEILDRVDRSVLIHQEIGFHNLLFQEDSVTVID